MAHGWAEQRLVAKSFKAIIEWNQQQLLDGFGFSIFDEGGIK